MASIYDIKPAFQKMLRPVVSSLARNNVTANQITVAAIGISIASGAMIAFFPQQRWPLLVLPAVLFLRMALNAIDGMLAREHDMKSQLGAVLNEVGDVVSDAAMYLPLALVPNFSAWLLVVFVVLSVISEMTGVVAQVTVGERRYDGPMGKSDRAFVIGVLSLCAAFGVIGATATGWVLAIMNIMLLITIVNRGRYAAKEAP